MVGLPFKRVAIVGVGLIGGSLGKAAKEKGLFGEVVGIGRNENNLKKARQLGIVDKFTTDLKEGVHQAELVILATPVGAIVDLIAAMTPHLRPNTIITDVGSVKKKIVREAEKILPSSLYFVGGHPIAGKETSGSESAFSHLFEGAKYIVTPTSRTNVDARERIEKLWEGVGCKIVSMDCDHHDKIFAAVSHLPHLIAYCLLNSLMDMKDFTENIFTYSAGGLKDFTRIALSPPAMWKDIVIMNKDNVLNTITYFQSSLENLKMIIENEDQEEIFSQFQRSKETRKLMR